MKKRVHLLFVVLALVSLLSCQKATQISEPQNARGNEYVALENEIIALNHEFNLENTKTRGFFSRLWHRVCCIAAVDAGGAAGAYDSTKGQGITVERGLDIVGSAIRRVDFIANVSQYTDPSIISDYSNRFIHVVNESNISAVEKNRINLYVSVATHSISLWSELD